MRRRVARSNSGEEPPNISGDLSEGAGAGALELLRPHRRQRASARLQNLRCSVGLVDDAELRDGAISTRADSRS